MALKMMSQEGVRYNWMYPSGYNEPEMSKSYLLVYNNQNAVRNVDIKQYLYERVWNNNYKSGYESNNYKSIYESNTEGNKQVYARYNHKRKCVNYSDNQQTQSGVIIGHEDIKIMP